MPDARVTETSSERPGGRAETIDAENGRVLALTYRGRGPGMYVGRQERFSDFRRVGPLTLPHARTVLFEGEPVANLAWQASEIAVNEPLGDEVFKVK